MCDVRDVTAQVSAKVRYLDDLPWDPDELHAAFVISTEGNAEIASVDAQAALVRTQIAGN